MRTSLNGFFNFFATTERIICYGLTNVSSIPMRADETEAASGGAVGVGVIPESLGLGLEEGRYLGSVVNIDSGKI